MEELGQSLDEEEFVESVCRLYDSVSLPEKKILMLKNDALKSSQTNLSSRSRGGR